MFVLDASVLAKQFLDEPGSSDVRAWVERTLDKGVGLRAPHLAFSEVGRIIQKEKRLPPGQAKELHESVFLGVAVAPLDPSSRRAWDFVGPGTSYYDAEYIELASSTGATLVTADRGQAQGAARAKVKVLSFVPGD